MFAQRCEHVWSCCTLGWSCDQTCEHVWSCSTLGRSCDKTCEYVWSCRTLGWSCDAGTACSLVLLQVTTAMGNKSQGQTPTSNPTITNSYPTDAMVTGQPMRAGRSQAPMAAATGTARAGSGTMVRDGGRDAGKQEDIGNFINNSMSQLRRSPPAVSGNSTEIEQKCKSSTTPQPQKRNRPQQNANDKKPFSYAQALKTKSSKLPEGVCRTPNSKLSSRSQTPSESSLVGGKEPLKGMGHGSGGNPGPPSGSPPLGYGGEGGTNSLDASGDDSLDLEFRSNSVLSLTTPTESVTSDRSTSRQSLSVAVDSAQRLDDDIQRATSNPGNDEGNELSGNDNAEVPLVIDAQNEHVQVNPPEDSPRLPPVIPDPPPTDQFKPPSPVATPNNPHPPTPEHSAPPPPPDSTATLSSPIPSQPATSSLQQDTTTRIEARQQSPVPPGLSPNKEHHDRSKSPSPPLVGEVNSSSSSAQVFKTLQQVAATRRTSDDNDGDKDRSSPHQAHLMAAAQKPLLGEKDIHSLRLAQPQRVQEAVLPNPVPTMTSILPHPPPIGVGLPSQQQHHHLPLRPPG